MSMNFSLHTIDRTLVNSISVAASVATSANINLAALGAASVTIVTRIGFGATPDANVTQNFYTSVRSGAQYTTVAFASKTITATASTNVIVDTTISDKPFVQVITKNNDSTDAVSMESWYSYQSFGDSYHR